MKAFRVIKSDEKVSVSGGSRNRDAWVINTATGAVATSIIISAAYAKRACDWLNRKEGSENENWQIKDEYKVA